MYFHNTDDVYKTFVYHFDQMLLKRIPEISEEEDAAYIKTIQYIQRNLYSWTYNMKGPAAVDILLESVIYIVQWIFYAILGVFKFIFTGIASIFKCKK